MNATTNTAKILGTLMLSVVACRGSSSGNASTAESGNQSSEPSQPTQGAESGPFRLEFDELEVDGSLGLVTDLAFLPGSMELLVLSLDGRVGHYAVEGDQVNLQGEFTVPGVYNDLDCGLISIALDPGFADNGLFYVGMCVSQQDSAIHRLQFDASDYAGIGASSAEIMVAGDPEAPRPWHNIGAMGFDDTGALWALFGDKRVSSHGQDVESPLSALVRIIPAQQGTGHEPAPDNPFVDADSGHPDVYAYGLRSPWRGALDAQGRWFVGDVGANGFEEIDMIDAPAQNLGWALHEGPCESGCEDVVDPLRSWSHDEITDYMLDDEDVVATNARVAWTAGPYVGGAMDQYGGNLDDRILFGDYCLGYVRSLQVDDQGDVVADEHLGHLALPVAWRQGSDGFLYTATFGRCETLGLDPEDPPTSRIYRVRGHGGGVAAADDSSS
ncbi:MAG: PQQ-dependent sugar dehydrogenase [Myxococcota bacterium]